MVRYVFSEDAEEDLKEIYRYGYFNYGEQKADQYIEALKVKCQFLADAPYICRERHEFTPPIRIHHHKKQMILYVIKTDYILIIRVLHERMETEQHLSN